MKRETAKIKYLLLGGGYTLSRVARLLPRGSFVITATSSEKVEFYTQKGYRAEILQIAEEQEVQDFFGRYDTFEALVDSIPPLFTSRQPESAEIEKALTGSHNIYNALAGKPPGRYIYLSTTGVYGATDGAIVTERTPVNPLTVQAEARVLTENIYRGLKTDSISLRISGIYGPGRGPAESIRGGRYQLVENGMRWSNRIHVEDLAQIIMLCLTAPLTEKLPAVMNVSDGSYVKTMEIVRYICERFELPLPKSITFEEARKRGLHNILTNQRVSNELLLKTLNYRITHRTLKDFLGS